MNWLMFRKCLLVSFFPGAIAPFFSIELPDPLEASLAIEIPSSISKNNFKPLTEKDFREEVEPYFWENKNRFQRIVEATFYPAFWVMYLKTFLIWISGFMVETCLASYLNTKNSI